MDNGPTLSPRPARLLMVGLLAASCVSVIETSEVLVEVTLPCEVWGETSGPFRITLHRTEDGAQEGGCSTNVDGEELQCFTSVLAIGVSCDEPTTLVFLAGNLPEIFGVRVSNDGSEFGYALMEAGTAGNQSIAVSPDMNPSELSDHPWCEPVSSCMADSDDALTRCEQSINPTPVPTPTSSPTEMSPTTSTPSQSTSSNTQDTSTEATATPAAETQTAPPTATVAPTPTATPTVAP